MTKMIGAAVFKATCLKLIDDMQKDGESVTITKRGKVVAIMEPVKPDAPRSIIGALAHPSYRFDADPSEPACDPADWSAQH